MDEPKQPRQVPASDTQTMPTDQVSKLGVVVAKVTDRLLSPPTGKMVEQMERQRERQRQLAEFEKQQEHDALIENHVDLLRRAGKRYANCTLKTFCLTDPKQSPVIKALRKYAANLPAEAECGNGIVLYGPSGTGKDHLLIALAQIAIREHGLKTHWDNGTGLFAQFRDAIDRSGPEILTVAQYTRPAILVLSDPIPQTEFQRAALFRVLDERYRNCRPTWVSLNVAHRDEADERLGPPLVDRLRHGSLVLHCDWPSYRTANPNRPN